MQTLLVFGLVMQVLFLPHVTTASDTDSEPYMVYIDPETGKYTTKKPGSHVTMEPATVTGPPSEKQQASVVTTRPPPETTSLTAALLLCGGLLVISHLFAAGLSRAGS